MIRSSQLVLSLLPVLLLGAIACGDDDTGIDASVPDSATADSAADAEIDAAEEDASPGEDAPPDVPMPLAPWEALAFEEPVVSRWGALVAEIGPGDAIVFGGTNANDGAVVFADTHRITIDEEGNLEAVEIESENGPVSRYCGCAAYIPERHSVLLAGGRDLFGPFTVAPETWELDLETSEWTELEVDTPAHTLGCHLVELNGEIYWFGGAGSGGTVNDLYRLDRAGNAWARVDASNPPRDRYDASIFTRDGRIWLFGGQSGSRFSLADLWTFDPVTRAWTEIETSTSPPGRRVPFVHHDATGIDVGFGFDAGMNPLEDLWRFDFETREWTETELEDRPYPRAFTANLSDSEGRGVAFGGYDGSGPIDEVLRLR